MNTFLKLRFVTITGADASVDPAELIEISKEFPFVEWAILAGSDSGGKARFPSDFWIEQLTDAVDHAPEVNLSLHLCGKLQRSIIMGDDEFAKRVDISKFRRVQINTHGVKQHWNLAGLMNLINGYSHHEFIFQLDGYGENEAMAKEVFFQGCNNVSFLIDRSHGAGILPEGDWPIPQLALPSCGYAGGLGPDNFQKEVMKIVSAIEKRTDFKSDWWVDMETNVRSNNDQVFDLEKVRAVLQIAKPWFEIE